MLARVRTRRYSDSVIAHDPGDEHADLAVDPPPEPASTWIARSMVRLACGYACRLGGPVYLVGSALDVPRPADVDIRVVLADHDLDRLFGARKIRDDNAYGWTEHDVRLGREQLKQ